MSTETATNTPILMEDMLTGLPLFVSKEIFKYVIPSESDIYFQRYECSDESNYNPKYELAHFHNGSVVENRRGYMFSRIAKKNSKYRYYITKKTENRYRCRGHRGCYEKEIRYESIYVGNDSTAALIRFFADSDSV